MHFRFVTFSSTKHVKGLKHAACTVHTGCIVAGSLGATPLLRLYHGRHLDSLTLAHRQLRSVIRRRSATRALDAPPPPLPARALSTVCLHRAVPQMRSRPFANLGFGTICCLPQSWIDGSRGSRASRRLGTRTTRWRSSPASRPKV